MESETPSGYTISRIPQVDESGKAYLKFYFEDRLTGKFVRWLTDEDREIISTKISILLSQNFDEIYESMGSGKSLGEILSRGLCEPRREHLLTSDRDSVIVGGV
jgi:hypothetical protein